MSVSRSWRLRKQRYALVGETCPACHRVLFPPREVCPYCQTTTHLPIVALLPGASWSVRELEPVPMVRITTAAESAIS